MMKKCKIAFRFDTSRRYFHFLILLLAFSFSKATCRPGEASAENPATSEKVYIFGGATIFVAEGTMISGAELVHKQAKKAAKTNILKKKVEKPKFVKRTTTINKPVASTPIIAI